MEQEAAGVNPTADYLTAVREHTPASTSEVAAAVGVTRQGADYRLRRLEEEGLVRSKMIGGSLAWFVAEADDDMGRDVRGATANE